MSPYVEAQGFQILPEGAKNIESQPELFFFNGLVVYEKWIHMCVKHSKFMPPSHEFRALVIKNGNKVPQLLKKKTAYTLLEVLEIWNEIQRIKCQPQIYKFKGNLQSRTLWSRVEEIDNIPCRSGESMRNFCKTWKNFTLPEVIKELREKDMRWSHAFAKPRYPFVSEEVDQAIERKIKPKNPGGRPRKPDSEKKSRKKREVKAAEKREESGLPEEEEKKEEEEENYEQ